MTNVYVDGGDGSTTGYWGVAKWQASHAYATGAIIRQLSTPTVGNERCYRASGSGTSGSTEPTWVLTKGGTTSDNGISWVEVTGNETYQTAGSWNAPHARISNALTSPWTADGDTIFVGNRHTATQSTTLTWVGRGTSTNVTKIISVNSTSGSVPPAAADYATTPQASESTTGNAAFNVNSGANGYMYFSGLSMTAGNGANSAQLLVQPEYAHFVNCAFAKSGTNVNTQAIVFTGPSTGAPARHILENCTMAFGNVGDMMKFSEGIFLWKNTASAIGGTVPTTALISQAGNTYPFVLTVDGVDLSAVTSGTLVNGQPGTGIISFVNCKYNGGATIATTPTSKGGLRVYYSAVGTGAGEYQHGGYSYEGTLTTNTTTYLAATDGDQAYSWKIVSTANVDRTSPFETFEIAKWQPGDSNSHTATIELTSASTLTNADIWVELQYLGTASNLKASTVSSGVGNPITSGTALTTSSASWTSAQTNKYKIAVTFTPKVDDYIRAIVKVGTASLTIYVDPLITVT